MRDDAILTLTLGEMMETTFQAFAKLPGGRTLTMLLASSDTIEHVKEMIHVESGIPRASMHLPCGRYLLNDMRCLSDDNIGRPPT